jgi:flagellar assembly protein FliH
MVSFNSVDSSKLPGAPVASEKRGIELPYRPASFEEPGKGPPAEGVESGPSADILPSTAAYRPVFRAPEWTASQAVSFRPFRWTELEQNPPEEVRAPEQDPGASAAEGLAEGAPPKALLDQARDEAAEIVAGAVREADGIREQARREGLECGCAEGRRRAEEAAGSVETVVAELARYKTSLYHEARQQVVELALAVVSKILGPLGESDERAVVRVVERAVQLLSDREHLAIRVNPGDLRNIIEAKPRILQTFDGIERLTVVEDPSIKRGGCVLQTPTTEIDARIDTQLQEVIRSVRSA